MEGVTILETIVDNGLHSSTVLVIFASLLALTVISTIELLCNLKAKRLPYAIGMFVVVCTCFAVAAFSWSDSQYSETRYVVSVDDSVNFNEFQNTYEIISKDGDNYVVKMIRE